jgi:malate dehydrogenase (oxaloacetate-decarboxylating)
VDPAATLAVSLDVGTDNPALLEDPGYAGVCSARLRGEAYDALLDEFVEAFASLWPGAVLQWEDFRKDNALRLLDRYRERLPSFNDDIQGTGATAVAGFFAALRELGEPAVHQRIVIHGAGAAGLGMARQLQCALEHAGLSRIEAHGRIAVLDSRGLLVDDRPPGDAYKRELAWPAERARNLGLSDPDRRGLLDVIELFRPTVLIGASGRAGAFDQAVIEAVAAGVDRPVVMPLSNPTDHAEARPRDVYAWTGGRALVATGSPFEPFRFEGRTIRPGQGNNVLVFPGLGLGTLVAGARRVTDGMVEAAAEAAGTALLPEEAAEGMLYPRMGRLREIARTVAVAVAERAREDGVANDAPQDAAAAVDAQRWEPAYRPYRRA